MLQREKIVLTSNIWKNHSSLNIKFIYVWGKCDDIICSYVNNNNYIYPRVTLQSYQDLHFIELENTKRVLLKINNMQQENVTLFIVYDNEIEFNINMLLNTTIVIPIDYFDFTDRTITFENNDLNSFYDNNVEGLILLEEDLIPLENNLKYYILDTKNFENIVNTDLSKDLDNIHRLLQHPENDSITFEAILTKTTFSNELDFNGSYDLFTINADFNTKIVCYPKNESFIEPVIKMNFMCNGEVCFVDITKNTSDNLQIFEGLLYNSRCHAYKYKLDELDHGFAEQVWLHPDHRELFVQNLEFTGPDIYIQ